MFHHRRRIFSPPSPLASLACRSLPLLARAAAPLAIAGLLLGAGLLAAPPVRAGSSGFLCPSSGRLISVGAPAEEVRRRCREPDDVQRRVELRTVRETRRVWTNGVAQEVEVDHTVEVPIEEWYFDFGPTRFTKTLRFETGRLVRVDEGPKGTVGGG